LGEKIRQKYLEDMFCRPQDDVFLPEADWKADELSIETVYGNTKVLQDGSAHGKLVSQMLKRLYGQDGSGIKPADAFRALNIPRIGNTASRELTTNPYCTAAITAIVVTLLDVGDITVSENHWIKLRSEFGEANTASLKANQHKLKRLRFIWDRIMWEQEKPTTATVEAKGKVAITGKISVKRSDFEAELIAAGYTPGSITKDTKFLITDNPGGTSSKNVKADQLGITKITEADFRSQYLS
jgi:hypothetical protein